MGPAETLRSHLLCESIHLLLEAGRAPLASGTVVPQEARHESASLGRESRQHPTPAERGPGKPVQQNQGQLVGASGHATTLARLSRFGCSCV